MKSITIYLLFLLTSLIISRSYAEEVWEDEIPVQTPVEAFTIDHNDRYGRVKVSDTRQNDIEYEEELKSGVMCTSVPYVPYSIFHDDSAFPYDPSGFSQNRENILQNDNIGFLITPNHIGKQTELTSLSAMTSWSSQFTNTHHQFCVRDYAQYGEELSIFDPYFKFDFDETNSNFDWIQFSDGKLGSKVQVSSKVTYGCVDFDAGPDFDFSKYIFMPSIQHVNYSTSHYGVHMKHYDSVWIEKEQDSSIIQTCWCDEPDWDRAHDIVFLQMITIPKTDSYNPTYGPIPKEDYIADSYSFKWPEGSNTNAYCVDIPFEKEFSFIPFIFVSLEMEPVEDEIDVNDPKKYYQKGTTIWVEDASTSGMQVCISELYYSDHTKVENKNMKIHYLVIEDMVGKEGSPSYQAGQGKISIKDFELTDHYDQEKGIFSEAFVTDAKNWVKSHFSSIQDKNMKIWVSAVPMKDGSIEAHIFFHILNSNNPEQLLKAFEVAISEATKQDSEHCANMNPMFCKPKHIFTPSAGNIPFFSKYMKKDAETVEIVPVVYGGSCKYGKFEADTCNPYPCQGQGGIQNLNNKIEKFSFGAAPECSNQISIKSPCETGFEVSSIQTHTFTMVAKNSETPWAMEYPRDRTHQIGTDDPPSYQDPDPPNTSPDPSPKSDGSGSGISVGLFIGVIAIFVVLMIGEFFIVKSYHSKQKKTAFSTMQQI